MEEVLILSYLEAGFRNGYLSNRFSSFLFWGLCNFDMSPAIFLNIIQGIIGSWRISPKSNPMFISAFR